MQKCTNKTGFTMIELLVVTTIIIVLTSISFVSFRGTAVRTRNTKREADISKVRSALEIYRSVYSSYPVYAGNNLTTNFTNLTANNAFTPFISSETITDPVNTGSYRYTYQSSGSGTTYSVCYYTEPATTQVCRTNP